MFKKIINLLFVFSVFLVAGENNSKPVLVIYTYDSFAASWGPAPKIKVAFEKEHNCTVKFVAASSSISALRKIQLEGNKTKADILLGLDTSVTALAEESDMFLAHELNITTVSMPMKWNDEIFVPYDYSYFSFVYNSDRLKNPPHNFEELVAMPKAFKIVIQDPRSSTPGLGLLLWIKSVYGDKAGEYWARLAPHILTVTKGWSEAYKLFLKGEADMVFSYTTSPAYHMIEENRTDIKAAIFKDGHYGQIEVAAIVKGSKHMELARDFLIFMNSSSFADIIPTTNWTYPTGQTSHPLPAAFGNLAKPSRMILMDTQKLKKDQKSIVDEWLLNLKK